MHDNELLNLWKSHEQQLDQVLSLNKEIVREITTSKLHRTLGRMRRPKTTALLIGVPYTLLLYGITFVAFQADAVFVTIGFGAIALIMSIILGTYMYHVYLIVQIHGSNEIVQVQENLSHLKLSSFNCTRLAVLQLPFWSVCWMSWDALVSAPLLYGSIHLVLFLGLSYLSYRLYQGLSLQNTGSRINRFFLSGVEWDPIIKSTEILKQLQEYK